MMAKVDKHCSAPWTSAVMKGNGVTSCCGFLPDEYGDWFTTDLKEAWLSEKAVAFRQAITKGKYYNDICRKCHEKNCTQPMLRTLNFP